MKNTKYLVGKNKNLHYGRVLMVSFFIAQMFFGYLTAFQPQVAHAQLNNNSAIATTKTTEGKTSIDVPKYQGVEDSIKQFLCTPPEDSETSKLGTALFDCIGKVYRFGIAFGAIALVFFVVLAGYFYITGGESGKGKGKTMFTTALVGMAIILSSYVLLRFINPDLVKIKVIQPPIFSAADLPSCEEVGFQGNCVLPSGQVQVPGGGGSGGVATSTSEKKWEALIEKYATAHKMTYCTLTALVYKESTYNQYAVSNFGGPGRSGSLNPSHSNKKYYDLTFTYAYPRSKYIGHGVGLTQVFIYGPPNKPQDPWQDSSTPSRKGGEFGYSRYLTVTDLIDPEISLNAGAYYFKKKLDKNKGNVLEAYREYTGGHENAALKIMVDKYDLCLKGGKK